jgi:hypothetical protein
MVFAMTNTVFKLQNQTNEKLCIRTFDHSVVSVSAESAEDVESQVEIELRRLILFD